MTQYHAVMIGEDGMEYGVSFTAKSRAEAYEYLRENYPESRCDQLEDPEQTRAREARIYARACSEYDDEHPNYEYSW